MCILIAHIQKEFEHKMPTFSFLLHQLDNVHLIVIGMWILHLIVFIVYGALVEYYVFCCIFFNLLLWVVAM